MNGHVTAYLQKYGIKDTPELTEKETLRNDDSYFYRIDDNLQGWYIKERDPANELEDLIITVLTTHYASY